MISLEWKTDKYSSNLLVYDIFSVVDKQQFNILKQIELFISYKNWQSIKGYSSTFL